MTRRLAPYGKQGTENISATGKGKTVSRLAARMPSEQIAAKAGVFKCPSTTGLAARMPSEEVAAKVGISAGQTEKLNRVVRLKASA